MIAPPLWERIRFGLAAKLALGLVLASVVLFAAFGFWTVGQQRRMSQELVEVSAERITDIIQRSTRYQMLRNDREALYQMIRDIGSEPGLRRVRIFNKEGRIRFTTDSKELDHIVDKQAEQCFVCHSSVAPLTHLQRSDRGRVFTDADGQRVLGVIRPIGNEAACSQAACHAHPASQQVLGVIDVHLSLEAIERQAARQQAMLLWFSAALLGMICALSLFVVWRLLHKPVRSLIAGTHRVASGDLDYRLPVEGHDELSDLAHSFNHMTAALAAAQAELAARADTAEAGFEKKTRELEHARNLMMDSERMVSLGKLAATVAHEVNNPLFGILTYARLGLKALRKGPLSEADRGRLADQLGVIERESRRCGDIIRNLLSFARQTPRPRAMANVNEAVQRAAKLIHHELELRSIELQMDLDPALPEVLCDCGQMQQVVLILLANASDVMPEGGRIWVHTGVENDCLVMRVRDDGPGIPAEILPHIFEPFFTTKEDQHRTGLGLAVARSLVQQHDGDIGAGAAPGGGAEFVIRLPLEPVSAGARTGGEGSGTEPKKELS